MSEHIAMDNWLGELAAELENKKAAHLLRDLRPVSSAQGTEITIEGTKYLQFCTNNYLGLADEPALVQAAKDALDRYGVGAGASRLVAGSMELHHQLELALARFKNAPAALLYPTGFMANLAVLTTFASAADTIVSDKLNHASLLDAARFSTAYHRVFAHRDYARAHTLLQRSDLKNPGHKFLVTDSVFSMDGDLADLPACTTLARSANALLIIDEAHATGVLGAHGRGLAEAQGVEGQVAVTISTLSKAFGVVGGFVTGPQAVIATLINSARPFIYTTALPPMVSAAALAALQLIASPEGQRRRTRVQALARWVRRELLAMGYDVGETPAVGNQASVGGRVGGREGGSEEGIVTPIIPVILGEPETAVHAAALLRQRGLYVPAIRPPTVPPKKARLRLSLMATHTDTQVERLLSALREIKSSLSL